MQMDIELYENTIKGLHKAITDICVDRIGSDVDAMDIQHAIYILERIYPEQRKLYVKHVLDAMNGRDTE